MNTVIADAYRINGDFNILQFVNYCIFKRVYRPVLTLRLCQKTKFMRPFFRLLHRWSTATANLELPWNTNIGAGFRITHGFGMVISKDCKIGSNVTIFHGVTVGAKDGFAPIIEDNVWVGPNVIIIGKVTIGAGARIAGGAVVSKDVPSKSIVAGNPAKIISYCAAEDVANKAIDLKK